MLSSCLWELDLFALYYAGLPTLGALWKPGDECLEYTEKKGAIKQGNNGYIWK